VERANPRVTSSKNSKKTKEGPEEKKRKRLDRQETKGKALPNQKRIKRKVLGGGKHPYSDRGIQENAVTEKRGPPEKNQLGGRRFR